jgi:hypothetical protein
LTSARQGDATLYGRQDACRYNPAWLVQASGLTHPFKRRAATRGVSGVRFRGLKSAATIMGSRRDREAVGEDGKRSTLLRSFSRPPSPRLRRDREVWAEVRAGLASRSCPTILDFRNQLLVDEI